MSPERWQRVEEVYHSALERAPGQRAAFLAEICGSDDELRREVESLLRHGDSQEALVDRPAWEAAGELLGTHTMDQASELAGRRISHYEILQKLGEGGMGAVYKARDTRLGRLVAIKTLPRDKIEDPDRKRRFVQEAKAASALNHPNIVNVYDIDQAGGVEFIAMEYVPGKTLGDVIGRKGLPLGRALDYAVQMAGALAAAHAAGIVHRDLKPANVMVTETGVVKLLDFGVAKLTQPQEPRATVGSVPVKTEEGAIVGTAAYMSPEQAEAKPVDARSDIFSFGTVLYEMVTGRRAFRGDTNVSALAAIIKEDPAPLGAQIPRDLEKVIKRCLRKDPAHRFQHMDDLRVALEELKEESESGALEAVAAPRPTRRWAWAVAVVAAVLLGAGAWYFLRLKPAETAMVRFAVGAPDKTVLGRVGSAVDPTTVPFAVSPDGRRVVLSATSADGKSQLWVRSLDTLAVQPLAGTEGAVGAFWSPDSRSIGFAADGKLKRIDVSGGPALTLADAPAFSGGTWSRDGVILFEASRIGVGLQRIPAAGGPSSAASKPDEANKEAGHASPWFLPDGRHFLFAAVPNWTSSRVTVRAGSLDSMESKVLLEANSGAVYAGGYLLFLRGSTLTAQPFTRGA